MVDEAEVEVEEVADVELLAAEVVVLEVVAGLLEVEVEPVAVVEVEPEVVDELEVLDAVVEADVVVVEAAPTLNTSILLLPPQYSKGLPRQAMLQSTVLAGTLPAVIELAQ
jgi:hypothetical protein